MRRIKSFFIIDDPVFDDPIWQEAWEGVKQERFHKTKRFYFIRIRSAASVTCTFALTSRRTDGWIWLVLSTGSSK